MITHAHFVVWRGVRRGGARTVVVAGLAALAALALALGTTALATTPANALPSASGPASLADLRFPPGSRVESVAERMWLHGMPVQVWVFDAPVDVATLIQALSRQQPALEDLRIMPGFAILSGRVGEAYWVLRLTSPTAGRSVGSMSSLSALATSASPPPAWLPSGARLRLDFAAAQADRVLSESIWQYQLSPSRLAPLLRRGLARDGWRDIEAGPGDGGWQSWQRRQERLQWLLVPLESGSGIWIRRSTP
ncbi:hypothetical protein [Achromobacter xylosoxidans]|uniref:hypothetical protein n=1 Tax=Alcaligenes xylosoxydans xylosoxydans TaxID=85698 RepID=UPI002A75F696|nr:hypothetical protein [Achromobacter xylosoxidans]WPQ35141.1 hypothetical protein SLH34_31825 [Achromobacter xylosoxidans]